MNKWLEIIHRENIYENVELLPFNPEANNINRVMNDVFGSFSGKDVTIIEVGSWKGSSAIEMANFFLNKGITPTIFCIDTFGGSTFHREHESHFKSLKCKNGFPTLYQQFLSNIIQAKLQDYIIPIPHTSLDAFRYIKKLGIVCDFCYIDACHEFEEVYQDVKNYYKLVKNGGTLLGDDFDDGWPGVTNAVGQFSRDENIPYYVNSAEWVIRKP